MTRARRRTLRLRHSGTIAIAVLAVACGSEAPQATTSEASSEASAATESDTTAADTGSPGTGVFDETELGLDGFPDLVEPIELFDIVGRTESTITVEHAYGQIEIPARPERIVVSYGKAEALISLGFDPIAHPSSIDMPPRLRAESPNTEWLEIADVSPNLEAIAALEPDLIIESEPWAGGLGEEANYETVSRIAPTLIVPSSNYWMDELRQFGELFDMTAEADRIIADYNARISELRDRARTAIGDDTVAIVLFFGLEPWLYKPLSVVDGEAIPGAAASWLYQELDLEPSADVIEAFDEDPTSEYSAVSAEFLPGLEADHLVVLPGGYSGEVELKAPTDDRVFTNDIGEPLRPGSIGQAFMRLVKSSGVRTIRLHDLRHTHASHLLAAGVNAKVVSERLGHSSVSFTLDVYGQVMPGQQAEAAALAASLLRR
jgi:ABC-type Fe3+-hydroxamate transport system substrate-binding protein